MAADWRDVGRYVVADGGTISICGPRIIPGEGVIDNPFIGPRLSGAEDGGVGYVLPKAFCGRGALKGFFFLPHLLHLCGCSAPGKEEGGYDRDCEGPATVGLDGCAIPRDAAAGGATYGAGRGGALLDATRE